MGSLLLHHYATMLVTYSCLEGLQGGRALTVAVNLDDWRSCNMSNGERVKAPWGDLGPFFAPHEKGLCSTQQSQFLFGKTCKSSRISLDPIHCFPFCLYALRLLICWQNALRLLSLQPISDILRAFSFGISPIWGHRI